MAKSKRTSNAAKKKTAKKKAVGKKVANKKVNKKKATKKTAPKKGARMASMAAMAPTGCCTLRGSGPDEQHEGLTRDACRTLAISKGKNFSWVPGLCAEPD